MEYLNHVPGKRPAITHRRNGRESERERESERDGNAAAATRPAPPSPLRTHHRWTFAFCGALIFATSASHSAARRISCTSSTGASPPSRARHV